MKFWSEKVCRHYRQWLGDMEYAELEKPTPWTGISVVFASLVCVLAMATDVVLGLRRKKPWLPPRFFVLNAAMITFLGMAVQTPNNPGVSVVANQLMKLGGMILIGVAMYHATPSLYLMNGRSLFSSLVALGLVLLTSTFQTWYQISTLHGRLSTKLFTRICAAYTVLLLLMYLGLVSHSLGVSSVREILEKKYSSMHETIVQEVQDNTAISTQILRRYLIRYLLMGFTSSPEFVVFTSGVYLEFSLLYVCINVMATIFWAYGWSLKNCYHSFIHKWSVGATLVIQCVALLLVLFLSVYRAYFSIKFSTGKDICEFFHAKLYMLQLHKLKEWKKIPLPFRLRSKKKVMVVARSAKYFSLRVLAAFQRTVAFLTLFFVFGTLFVAAVIFVIFVIVSLPLMIFCICGCGLIFSCLENREEEYAYVEPKPEEKELLLYILELEDDDDAKQSLNANDYSFNRDYMIHLCTKYQNRWLRDGEAKQPKQLLRLLEKHPHNNHPMTAPTGGRPWCLRLATLECIIRVAFHRSCDGNEWAMLEAAVDECFSYAVLVDGLHTRLRKYASMEMRRLLESLVKKFSRLIAEDGTNPTASKRVEAGRMVREGLLLADEWLGVPLCNPAERNPIQVLRAEAARRMYRWRKRDRGDWPLDAFAAESIEELTEKLLTGHMRFSSDELERVVAPIVVGCLRELPLAIFLECSSGSYGRREKHVEFAARILGETSMILELFEQADNPSISTA